MTQIELLAPAKDCSCGIDAIKCGADAVYIGGPSFGARKSAGNSLEEISKLIEFAHKYYAKVYVTVNTILDDNEIQLAQKLIQSLYDIEADAIIIQDTGLLEIDLPPIPLIASTQMHNNNLEKVKFLEKIGFKRTILARELSLQEIEEIGKNTRIELEGFVHGALCVCYSGQCYLSYAIGGRSGNRGECAQPCRKKYTLVGKEGKIIAKDQYLLSLKDFNLSNNIEDLIKAGITSFKIEGRLKDSAYIKNVVSYYRIEIDKVLEKLELKKASSGASIINFKPDLHKTFNRDYTTYFIKGERDNIASMYTPKSIGEEIGTVKKVEKSYFYIDTKKELSAGDGICFFDDLNTLQGTYVNKVIKDKVFSKEIEHIRKGIKIFRNLDSKFVKELNSAKIERLISVKLELINNDKEIILKATDENNNSAESKIITSGEIAKNKELATSNLEKSLSKLGNTEFNLVELNINLDKIYFIPVKDINELRRSTIENLIKERKKNRSRDFIKIVPNDEPYPEKDLDFSANIYNKFAENFYRRHQVEKLEPAAETMKDLSGKKVMTTKHCLKHQFNLCPKHNNNVTEDEPLFLKDEQGKLYDLQFDCKNCQMEIYF